MKKFRYVGAYGKKHRCAAVPYIGDLFQGDEVFHDEESKLLRFSRPGYDPVEATDKALDVLHGDEFCADLTCEHRFASGECCQNKPTDGGVLCKFHAKLANMKQKSQRESINPSDSPQTPFYGADTALAAEPQSLHMPTAAAPSNVFAMPGPEDAVAKNCHTVENPV
jgi:hypothetical protein